MQVERILVLLADRQHGRLAKSSTSTRTSPALFTLSVTAPTTAAGRAALAKARLALAVFEIPRHPELAHGMWVDRHIVDPPAASGAFKLVHRKFVTVGARRHPAQRAGPALAVGRSTCAPSWSRARGRASRCGKGPRPATSSDHLRPWSVEKSIAAGPSKVRAAVATVPAGVSRWVAILVYERYQ